MNLKAPYNFVPLNKTVVKPHWANYVNHDLPFDDAQSGHLEIELVAKSPLYVRNGVPDSLPKEIRESERKLFSQHQNRYFIPGSSLKGMIRSVLEIMSFGRITDKIDDVTLAQRDFSNPNIYPKEKFAKEIFCGWLKKEGGEYRLKDCGKPGRITHEALSGIALHRKTGVSISVYYQQNHDFNNKDVKSAKSKYELFFAAKTGKELGFKQTDEKNNPTIKKYTIDELGSTKGRIVMTGQPAKVDPKAGKRMAKHSEFVFFTSGNGFKSVDERVIKNLKVAFFDGEKNEGPDWEWRKAQLENGEEIPVFFRKEGEKVRDMGLSFLYKMAYKHSIRELAQQEGDTTAPDFADTLFGYVSESAKSASEKVAIKALKGRVQFGHAFLEGHAESLPERSDVLAGPKASYYPTYILQGGGGYLTYNDKDKGAQINGWKRYPIRRDGTVSKNPAPTRGDGTINTDVASTFCPVQAGATFRFRIKYHNLRRDELGALISAITFHNTPDTYHSLGLAKPLGYGKVSLMILKQTVEERENYLRVYEGFMRSEVTDWHKSEQLQELVAMAQEKATADNTDYMELAGFKAAKDNKEYLQKHSELYPPNLELATLLSEVEFQERRAFYDNEKKLFKRDDAQKKTDKHLLQLEEIKSAWEKAIRARQDEVNKEEERKIREEERLEREEIEAKRVERERLEREANSQKAEEEGPNFLWFKVTDREALDRTRNEMRKYGNRIHGGSIWGKGNDKKVRETFPNGYVRDAHQTKIIDQFTAIYQHLSDKEKATWKLQDSPPLGYLQLWIGPVKANDVFNNLP